MNEATDSNLLDRYAACGDGGAFQEFTRRFAGMVHAAALRQLGDETLAEEVVQVVFTQAAAKARALSRHGVPAAWLHRATRLECLKVLRAERRRRSRESAAFFMNDHPADHDYGPDWAALQPMLDEALDALKEPEREALLLRFFKDGTYREVGAALAVQEDTAKMRVARALEKLRLFLARRGIHSTTAALGTVLSGHAGASPLSGPAVHVLAKRAMAGTPASCLPAGSLGFMIHTKALTAGLVMGLTTGELGWRFSSGGRLDSGSAPVIHQPSYLTLGKSRIRGTDLPSSRADRPGVAEVFAGLQRLLSNPETETNRLELRLLLAELEIGGFSALTDLIDQQLPDDARRRLMPEVARIWAASDPGAAMARLARCPSPPYQAGGVELARSVFSQWHEADPAAAQRWLVEYQDDPAFQATIQSHISTVAHGLLGSSEQAVVDWAGKLEGEDYRRAALEPLWDRYLKQDGNENRVEDLVRLYRMVEQSGDESLSRLGLSGLAVGWARYRGAEWDRFLQTLTPGPLAWQAALDGISNAEVVEIRDGREMDMNTVESRKALLDRLSAALRMAGDRTTGQAVSEVLSRTGLVSKQVREWALPLLTGPERAPAVAAFARKAMQYRGDYSEGQSAPEMALDWAREHPEPAVRDPLIYGLYRKWLQEQRGAAEQFRGKQDWPAGLRAILIKAESELQP